MELWGCDREALDSPTVVHGLMRSAAKIAKAKPVLSSVRHFDPQGVTAIMMVQESHFSIHTWPEEGYAAVDAYTCGDCDPVKAVRAFERGLKAERVEVQEIVRGVRRGAQGLAVAS
jgi:S-adenosylmethionine decarboxylase proenzyme